MEEVKMDDSRALDVVAREPDPKLSENALRVLQKRYLKKDDTGRVIETPQQLFARVAWTLAQAERTCGAHEAQTLDPARRFRHITTKGRTVGYLETASPATRDAKPSDQTSESESATRRDHGLVLWYVSRRRRNQPRASICAFHTGPARRSLCESADHDSEGAIRSGR